MENEHGAASSAATSQNLRRGLTADGMEGHRRDLRGSRRQSIGTSGGWVGWAISRLNLRNGCYEPVTRPGDCLHIEWELRAIAQSLPNFTDGRIDSVFDVDEDFLLPQAPGNLFAIHDLAVFADQKDEEFERFSFELEPAAVAGELKFAAMEAEVAESIDGKGHGSPRGG